MIRSRIIMIISIGLISFNSVAIEEKTLKKFSGYDEKSDLVIKYDDVDLILDSAVLFVGKSSRAKASKKSAKTGTRLKNKSKPYTALEGNRFYYKGFDSPEKVLLLTNIRKSLEQLPASTPLKYFTKDEQLAYWLNLYNISVLEQLVDLYPKRSLKSDIEGDLMTEKFLNISGEKLSLDDIKQIVIYNFGYDPLLIYGFHQGNIAGPDIRGFAYTGKDVWQTLEKNADWFINSNRGTFSHSQSRFRVSYLYEQYEDFFKAPNGDLKSHLEKFLLRSHKEKMLAAKEITIDIEDWGFADVHGGGRNFGGSIASNSAALIDAFVPLSSGVNEVSMTNAGVRNGQAAGMSPMARFSAENQSHLMEILKVREVRSGSVTVKDLDENQSDEDTPNKGN